MKYTTWETGTPIDRKMYPHIFEVVDPWGKRTLYPTRDLYGVAEWIGRLTYNMYGRYGKNWDRSVSICWEDGSGNITYIDKTNSFYYEKKCLDKWNGSRK